jgi:arylsulfatase A-like enzyme
MKKLFVCLAIIVFSVVAVHVYLSYRPYNVVLITIDTLRADFLSCYNPQVHPTRNIDLIARKGVLFKNAFTLIPITLPSHTSILTSRMPHEISLFTNGEVFNHKEVPMVTDFLKKKGYTSGAFISLGVLRGEFGLGSGFDSYEDNFDKMNGRYYKVASEVNEVALPWIEKNHKKKFFAWIHYSDPHEPYIPFDAPNDTEVIINGVPFYTLCIAKKEKHYLNFVAQPGENRIEFRAIVPQGPEKIQYLQSRRFLDRDVQLTPSEGFELNYGKDWPEITLTTGAKARYFEKSATLILNNKSKKPVPLTMRFSGGVWGQRTEEARENYGTEVQFVDKNIGLLWQKLRDLNIQDKTIIIITADHGEGLKTHGIMGHVDRLWNEIIHVPLIVYYPLMGVQGKSVDAKVTLLDIMPTILDLLHVRNKSKMDGQSLKHYLSRSPLDWIMTKKVQRERIFTYTFAPEAKVNSFAVTDLKTKVIHTPNKRLWQWEGYDLPEDPLEKRNLARFQPKVFSGLTTLRTLLDGWQHDAEAAHNKRQNPKLDERQEEMLRNLGYVAGSENHEKE